MADCTKTAEFIRELVRLCESNEVCSTCPLRDEKRDGCRVPPTEYLSTGAIAIVQKWSDEHPVITWAGKLKELLPNANIEDVIAPLCPRDFFGGIECPNQPGCDYDCVNCWNGEYKEEP